MLALLLKYTIDDVQKSTRIIKVDYFFIWLYTRTMKELTMVSNIHGEDEHGNPIFIDRIYGADHTLRLIQKDGKLYDGAIHKRRISVKGISGNNFFSHVYETADGRWFNRAGMPIEKPTNLTTKSEEDTNE